MADAKKEKTVVSPIAKLWSRDEKTLKQAQLTLAERRLQAGAESYLVEAQGAVLDAEAAHEKALAKSLKSPDFSAIVNAQLTMRTAQVTLDQGRASYKELFGSEPKL